MTPYYQRGGIVIFHGDARDVLPSLTFDTLITDPVWPNASVRLPGADRPCDLFREILAAAGPRSRLAVHLGVDSDPRFLQAVPDSWPFFRVCWLELARVGYKGRLLMTGDVAYLFGMPPRSRPGHRVIPGRYMDATCTGKESEHECPRKLGHAQWLVNWWTEPEDTVCDPMMGSGTTLLAAKNLGRRAVGIDIREKDCEMAARRLDMQDPLPFGLEEQPA